MNSQSHEAVQKETASNIPEKARTMIKSTGSVEIDRPIEEVFEYTNNNVAEWSKTVVRDEPLDTKPDRGVGSTFLCVTQSNGKHMEFQRTITGWEPPMMSASQLIGDSFDIDVAYAFEDLDGRTRVTQVSIVRPKSFLMKIIFRLMGKMAQKSGCDASENELLGLKQRLEEKMTLEG